MALNIKTEIDLQESGETIFLYDDTGVYTGVAGVNELGWSDGIVKLTDPRQADVDSCTITISSASLTYTQVLTGTALAQYLDPKQGLTLRSDAMFGTAYEVFEDGIYTIHVLFAGANIQGSPSAWTAEDEIYEGFIFNLKTKVSRLVMDLKVPIRNYLEAYNTSLLNVFFDDIHFLCEYGRPTEANEILTWLNELCDNNTQLAELFKKFNDYA